MTRKTVILTGFILLKFLLQYILISSGYDLHRDEYLHLDQAQRHVLLSGCLSHTGFKRDSLFSIDCYSPA